MSAATLALRNCSLCNTHVLSQYEHTVQVAKMPERRNFDLVVTCCSHLYHNLCLAQWHKEKKTCPLDQGLLKKEDCHLLHHDWEIVIKELQTNHQKVKSIFAKIPFEDASRDECSICSDSMATPIYLVDGKVVLHKKCHAKMDTLSRTVDNVEIFSLLQHQSPVLRRHFEGKTTTAEIVAELAETSSVKIVEIFPKQIVYAADVLTPNRFERSSFYTWCKAVLTTTISACSKFVNYMSYENTNLFLYIIGWPISMVAQAIVKIASTFKTVSSSP